jgi:hypothetical protein
MVAAAGAGACLATSREGSGEPIPTPCGNDDIPERRSNLGEVRENVYHRSSRWVYTKV